MKKVQYHYLNELQRWRRLILLTPADGLFEDYSEKLKISLPDQRIVFENLNFNKKC